MTDEQVEVTQADREAAADYLRSMFVEIGQITLGKTSAAFARHRLACSAPSALPEDDGKLIDDLNEMPDRWILNPHASSLVRRAATRIETLFRDGGWLALMLDQERAKVETLSREIERLRVAVPSLDDIGEAATKVDQLCARVRAKTLEEAAKAMDALAQECRDSGSDRDGPSRSPESCYEYAASKLRSLTTGSAAGQETS